LNSEEEYKKEELGNNCDLNNREDETGRKTIKSRKKNTEG